MALYHSRQTRRWFLKLATAVGGSVAAYAAGLVPELTFAGRKSPSFGTVDVAPAEVARRVRRVLAGDSDAVGLVSAQLSNGLDLNSAGATAVDWIDSGKKVGSTLLVPFTSATSSSRHEYLIWRESNGVAAVAVGSFEQTAGGAYNLEAREWDARAQKAVSTHAAIIDSVGISVSDLRIGQTRSSRWDDHIPASQNPTVAQRGNIMDVSASNCSACEGAANILINTVGCTALGAVACVTCAVAGPIGVICAVACGSIIALICWYNSQGLQADANGICRSLGYC